MSDELEQKIKKLEIEAGEGAPAWVVTFGDLMSLLLCFFVLLLSFSEMDKNVYKEIAGSLSKAFGIQRKTPAFDSPKGEKIIARDFDQDTIATREKKEIGREVQKEVETRFHGIKDLIQVETDDTHMTIRLMGESTFDSGKAEIRDQLVPLLEKIASVLKNTKGDIIVAGHTDNRLIRGGRFKDNLGLSIARAASVARFLLHGGEIEPQRISTMGLGKYRPIETNDTPYGREKNRRVEIILTLDANPAS